MRSAKPSADMFVFSSFLRIPHVPSNDPGGRQKQRLSAASPASASAIAIQRQSEALMQPDCTSACVRWPFTMSMWRGPRAASVRARSHKLRCSAAFQACRGRAANLQQSTGNRTPVSAVASLRSKAASHASPLEFRYGHRMPARHGAGHSKTTRAIGAQVQIQVRFQSLSMAGAQIHTRPSHASKLWVRAMRPAGAIRVPRPKHSSPTCRPTAKSQLVGGAWARQAEWRVPRRRSGSPIRPGPPPRSGLNE